MQESAQAAPNAPFIRKRLKFTIADKQKLVQDAYDYAAHVHGLRQMLA